MIRPVTGQPGALAARPPVGQYRSFLAEILADADLARAHNQDRRAALVDRGFFRPETKR